MTVSSSTAKTGPLACDGVTTEFDFSVQMQTDADVRVLKTVLSGGLYSDVDLVIDTDYTVTLNADQNASPGGTITCLTAPEDTASITVLRNVSATQGASIPNQGGFYPKVIENALDRLTMLVQQLQADIGRAYRISYGDTSESNISDLVSAVAVSANTAVEAAAEAVAAAATLDLGNVDNTSDLDKPISDDTQAALDLKVTAATPSISGTLDCNNNNITEIKTASFSNVPTLTTTTGAVTVDWSAAQNYYQNEPTGNITYTFTAPPGPCHLQLFIASDGTTAARTFTWPASVIWIGATWTHTANKKAIINFWYDGTKYYAQGASQV